MCHAVEGCRDRSGSSGSLWDRGAPGVERDVVRSKAADAGHDEWNSDDAVMSMGGFTVVCSGFHLAVRAHLMECCRLD